MAFFNVSREFWLEFINLYRELPALWKVKSDEYNNRKLKSDSYQLLVDKLKLITPNADVDMVKKKINVLRSNYRKELRKLKTSNGRAYEPTLWYFKEIDFLRCQEPPTPESSFNDNDEEYERVNDLKVKLNESSSYIHRIEAPQQKNSIKHIECLPAACDPLLSYNDEAEIMAKVWAMEYQKLSPDQQMFAKKAINDVLFEGRLGTLHRDSVVINEPRFATPSTPLQESHTAFIKFQPQDSLIE